MKIFICGDVHWCANSSILRSRGVKYTTRLENLIKTINWVEEEAVTQHCDAIFFLGDFFDSSTLDVESLTALQEIRWSNLPHLFLVGNHEMGRSSLEFSSAHLLKLCPNITIIDKPYACHIDDFHRFLFLPYSLDSTNIKIKETFGDYPYHTYIFSHNDLAGLQMGKFKSTEGLDIEDIINNCDFFFNGHLHNGEIIKDKIINVGNITGQNFSEDADRYYHCAKILNTTDNFIVGFENPFALNFYKLDFCEKDNVAALKKLKSLRENSVITLHCYADQADSLKEFINENCPQIVESRFIIERKSTVESGEEVDADNNIATADFSIDHLKAFSDFILQQVGSDELTLSELGEVIR